MFLWMQSSFRKKDEKTRKCGKFPVNEEAHYGANA